MPISLRSALGVAATVVATHSAAAQGAPVQPFRALFIGNSYIYVNDLPAVIGDLAAAAHEPRRFEPYVVLVGGRPSRRTSVARLRSTRSRAASGTP